ncbi:Ig-like domain-containing protein [Paenibacillus wenxiniae]|uniref:Ig-like domain-containing protein n=1 Tax=Paenibacillus wenxiniae TaxID=1636843 RepID=A0ABW4RIR7_9BACL
MIKKTKETSNAKKMIQFAGTSILATGIVAAPGVTLANGDAAASTASTPTSYQINQGEPEVYHGDSIAYFQQKFFKGQSTLTVGESGSAPIAQSFNFVIKKSAIFASKVQATDQDENDTLSYQLVSQPENGTLTLDGQTGEFTYIGDEAGTYTFSYRAIDSHQLSSEPATVTLVVEKDKDKDKDKNKSSAPVTPAQPDVQPAQPAVPPTATAGDMTIDAVHTDNSQSTASNSNGRTRGVATLSAASTEQNAVLNVLYDRIANTIKEAQPKQSIAIDASILKDKQQYQLNFAGNVVQDLLSKQNGLTLQTGDINVQLPSSVLSRVTQQQNLSTDGAATWTLTTQKVAAPVTVDWKGTPISPVANTAYQLNLAVVNADTHTTPSTYENRYVKLSFAVPEAIGDTSSYIALATDAAGHTYTVPVTFDAQGQATVHTLEGSTVQIVKAAAPATSSSSTAMQLLEQKQIVPTVDRAPASSDRSLTRGQLALYLSRALGVNTANVTSSTFTDLGTASEESRAVEALFQAGVLKGVSNTEFAPDRVISREQLAVILTRAASAYGLSENSTAATGTAAGSSSKWAQDELQQALAQGNDTGIRSSGNASLTANPDMSQSEGAQTLVDWLKSTKLVN